MNFFRESRRGLTSRTGLCSSRRQRMGAIPSEIDFAESLEEHGLKRRLEDLLGRDVCGFACLEGARTCGTSLSEDCL
jgi:hypothetical protein